MNYLPQLLAPAITEALGWTILHSLWQSTFIAVLLSVAMLLLHRQSSQWRYRVAICALFLNLLAALATFNYYYSPNPVNSTAIPVMVPAAATSPIVSEEMSFTLFSEAATYFSAHLPLLVTLWLLGMAMMLLRFIGGLAYLQRLKFYKNIPVPAPWQNRLHHLSQELKINKATRLAESVLVQTPVVIGFLKPVILLPLGTLSDLPVAQAEAILAHELAHLKRHDYFFNLLQSLTEVIFFYHPAIWWISDYVRIERENCCDDLAVAVCGDSLAYAHALATLAQKTSGAPGLSLAFAGKDGSLLARIKRLVQAPNTRPSFTDGFVAATVLLLSLTFLSATALANLKPGIEMPPALTPAKPVATIALQNPPLFIQNNPISVQDSVPKSGDLVIIKNRKGKITEVYIDGQKIPKDKLPAYANRIDQALATQQQGKVVAADDAESLRKAQVAVSRLNRKDARQIKPVIAPAAPPVPSVPGVPAVPAVPPAPAAPPEPPAKPGIAPPAPPRKTPTPAKGSFLNNESVEETFRLAQINFDSTLKAMEQEWKVQEENFRKQEMAFKGQLANLNFNLNLNENLKLQEKLAKEHALIAAEHAKISKRHADSMDKLIKALKKDGLYKEGKNHSIKINNDDLFIDGKKQSEQVFRKYKKYLPHPEKDAPNQSFEFNHTYEFNQD